jgi:hypothetical protein
VDANNSPAEVDILDFDPECLAHSATGERDECDQRIAAFG